MSSKKSNHFLVQGSILAAASLIVRLIGLFYRIPMNRIIGNEGAGYYAVAFDVYNIALVLSSYSLPVAVSKLVATRGINKEHKNAYRVFLCAMGFALVIGLIASSIIFFGASFFAGKYQNAILPLKILAPTIFIFSIMGVLRGYFQGKNTMIPTAISQVIEQIVNALVSVVASYLLVKNFSASENVASYGAAGGTLGTLIGAMVGLCFLMFVFFIYRPILHKQLKNDTSTHRESYKDIFKLLILTIAPIILSQTVYHVSGVIDNNLFGYLMSTKEVTAFELSVLPNAVKGEIYTEEYYGTLLGIYSNKYRLLTNVPVAIASAIGAAMVTSIAAANVRGMEDSIRSKIHSSIKFNMIIAIPSAVGMAVLASPILQLLFNDRYQLSANFFYLGSIAIVFYALSTVQSSILQGINRLNTPVINSAISLGVHIILVYVLLKFTPLNSYALVIGNVTFPLMVSILNWLSIEKYLNYKQELLKTFIIPTISAGLMGIAAYLIYQGMMIVTGINAIAVMVSIVFAVVIYFILLIFMKGIDESEISSLPKGYLLIKIFKRIHLL